VHRDQAQLDEATAKKEKERGLCRMMSAAMKMINLQKVQKCKQVQEEIL
jgi:hypothetical protein